MTPSLKEFGDALQDGRDEAALRLVREGLDISETYFTGDKAMGMAALAGNVKVLGELLARGARIDERGSNGETPLMRAAVAGQASAADFLLGAGADVGLATDSLSTALNISCQHGFLDTVEVLLNNGADVNRRGTNDATPLIDAVVASTSFGDDLRAMGLLMNRSAVVDYGGVVELLLRRGADPNLQTSNGSTALSIATKLGSTEMESRLRARTIATANLTPKKSGCYVATYVYGTYDCPELWMLRRWRDEKLDRRFIGRVFIRIYYRVSPNLIGHLGSNIFFAAIARTAVGILVRALKQSGYSQARYDLG